jgi:hypothetical protein
LWTTRLLARHAREHGPAEGHPCLDKLVQGTVCKILDEQEVKPRHASGRSLSRCPRLSRNEAAWHSLTSAVGAFPDPDDLYQELAHMRAAIDLRRQAPLKSRLLPRRIVLWLVKTRDYGVRPSAAAMAQRGPLRDAGDVVDRHVFAPLVLARRGKFGPFRYRAPQPPGSARAARYRRLFFGGTSAGPMPRKWHRHPAARLLVGPHSEIPVNPTVRQFQADCQSAQSTEWALPSPQAY